MRSCRVIGIFRCVYEYIFCRCSLALPYGRASQRQKHFYFVDKKRILLIVRVFASACLRFLRSALRRGKHALFVLTGAKHRVRSTRGVWGDEVPPRRLRVSGRALRALCARAQRSAQPLVPPCAFRRNAQGEIDIDKSN